MGKPKFSKKKYETPNHPWKEERIKAENELMAKYGLKNKREIWKAETVLRQFRGQARGLLAKISSDDPQTKKELQQLLSHLTRYSILPVNSNLDDVLTLGTEDILNRRLQTLTYLKGFASTPKQARQLINHGHIAINGRAVNVPGYRVAKNEEQDITYTLDSPLNDQAHPARPSGDFVSKIPAGGDESPSDRPSVQRKPKEGKPVGKPTGDKPAEPKQDKQQKSEKPAGPEGTDKKPEKPAEPKKDQGEKPAEPKKDEKPEKSMEQKEQIKEKPEDNNESKPVEKKGSDA